MFETGTFFQLHHHSLNWILIDLEILLQFDFSYCQFTKQHIFLINDKHDSFQVELATAQHHSSHLARNIVEPYHLLLDVCRVERYVQPTFVVSGCRIKPEIDLGLETTVHCVASAFDEN